MGDRFRSRLEGSVDHDVLRAEKVSDKSDARDALVSKLMANARESSNLFASLEARYADKEKELQDRLLDLRDCEDALYAAQEDLRRAQKSLDDQDEELVQLRRDLEGKQNLVRDLENDLRSRDRELDDYTKDARREILALEKDVIEKDRTIATLESNLMEADGTIALMKEMIDEKHANIELLKAHHDVELDSQGGMFNSVLEKWNDKFSAVRAENDDLNRELEAAKRQLKEVERERSSLREKVLDLEEQNGSLMQKVEQDSYDRKHTMAMRVEELNRKLEDVEASSKLELDKKDRELRFAKAETERLVKEVKSLQDELEAAQSDRLKAIHTNDELNRVLRERDGLKDELRSFERKEADDARLIHDQKDDILSLKTELRELKAVLSERQHDLERLAEDHHQLVQEHSLALEDVGRLQEQAEMDQKQIDDLRRSNDMLRDVVEQKDVDLQQYEGLKDEREALHSRIEELRDSLEQSKAKLLEKGDEERQLLDDLQVARDHIRSLEEELKEKTREVTAVNESYMEQTMLVKRKNQELEELREQTRMLHANGTSEEEVSELQNALREAEDKLDILIQLLEKTQDAQQEACKYLAMVGPEISDKHDDGKMKRPHELMRDISSRVAMLCEDIAMLDKSRARNRRDREDIICTVLEDPDLSEWDWGSESSASDAEEFSDHPSGGARWAKTKVRIRSVVDRLHMREKEVAKWKRKYKDERREREHLIAMTVPQHRRKPSMSERSRSVEDDDRATPYLGLITDSSKAPRPLHDDGAPGVLVYEVVRNSAAERSGLQAGDRIIEIDQHLMTSTHDMHDFIHSLIPGDTVQVLFIRNSSRRKATLVVDSAQDERKRRKKMKKKEIRRATGGKVPSRSAADTPQRRGSSPPKKGALKR